MSKPNHRMRGKGYYIGYGYMSTDLNAKKGCMTYEQNMTQEISSAGGHVSGTHFKKLCRYLGRVQ